MQTKIAHYNEIVSLIMHFIAALTFFFVVQIMISGQLSPFYVHILFVVCFFAVIGIRLFINANFLIYMIAHFTLYLTLFAIPLLSVMFIVFAVYLVALTVWSVSYWKGNEITKGGQVPWISITLFCISYIYAFVSHHGMLKNYILVAGSIYLILFLIRFYLIGLYDLAHNHLYNKELPLIQIVKSNSYLVGMLIILTALAMILSNIIDIDELLYVIADGLIVILRVLIKGFFALLTWIADLLSKMGMDDMESIWDALGKAVMEENAGSKIVKMILSILKIAITAAFLMWVLRGLNIRVRSFLKDNTLAIDKVERLKVKDKGIKVAAYNIIRRKNNEPDSPIRRKYKRYVKTFGKRLILTKSVTTGEIEAQLDNDEADKMRPLKEAYERERYLDEK